MSAVQWVLASGNRGKLAEFADLLAPLAVEVRPQSDWNLDSADETGLTFVENALIKARASSRATGLQALADDSGLCVDALGGAPGIYSARYAGAAASDAHNNAALLQALDGVAERSARYYCCLVWIAHWQDPMPTIAWGEWRGHIAQRERGAGGFGYDPLFVSEGGLTAAELEPAVKHRQSHRGLAARTLLEQLQRRLG